MTTGCLQKKSLWNFYKIYNFTQFILLIAYSSNALGSQFTFQYFLTCMAAFERKISSSKGFETQQQIFELQKMNSPQFSADVSSIRFLSSSRTYSTQFGVTQNIFSPSLKSNLQIEKLNLRIDEEEVNQGILQTLKVRFDQLIELYGLLTLEEMIDQEILNQEKIVVIISTLNKSRVVDSGVKFLSQSELNELKVAKNDILQEKHKADRFLRMYPFYPKFNLMQRHNWEAFFKNYEPKFLASDQRFQFQTQKKILDLELSKILASQNRWDNKWIPDVQMGVLYSRTFPGYEGFSDSSEFVGRIGFTFFVDDFFNNGLKIGLVQTQTNKIREQMSYLKKSFKYTIEDRASAYKIAQENKKLLEQSKALLQKALEIDTEKLMLGRATYSTLSDTRKRLFATTRSLSEKTTSVWQFVIQEYIESMPVEKFDADCSD